MPSRTDACGTIAGDRCMRRSVDRREQQSPGRDILYVRVEGDKRDVLIGEFAAAAQRRPAGTAACRTKPGCRYRCAC